jgi:hypothetical protein
MNASVTLCAFRFMLNMQFIKLIRQFLISGFILSSKGLPLFRLKA